MAPRDPTMVARASDRKTMTVSVATLASNVMTVGMANMPLSWDKAPEARYVLPTRHDHSQMHAKLAQRGQPDWSSSAASLRQACRRLREVVRLSGVSVVGSADAWLPGLAAVFGIAAPYILRLHVFPLGTCGLSARASNKRARSRAACGSGHELLHVRGRACYVANDNVSKSGPLVKASCLKKRAA